MDDAQTATITCCCAQSKPSATIRRECVRLVKELELPVEYLVLPTFAYEHKIFLGPFSRAFPQARVWIAPRSAVHISSIAPDCFAAAAAAVMLHGKLRCHAAVL